MNTPTQHRNTVQRTAEPAAELRVFSNIYCQTCRVLDFPITHTGLALALHEAYDLGANGWGLCIEFARFYTESWTRREEMRTHAGSLTGGAA